ncbi:MAG: Rrf2 family transcriptional regulator [Balneolaceae bacterium]|nr:Rrf2 family transcriptional regulator [Balneolaceae bacterium]
MSLSYSCIYGLRASVLLAGRQGEGFVTIRELSDELDISFHFLTKVLQHLTQAQILESYKGPNGGVKLARNAEDITIQEIIKSLDKDYAIPECALGLPIFQNHKACPIHEEWTNLKIKMEQMVETVTIRELAEWDQKI